MQQLTYELLLSNVDAHERWILDSLNKDEITKEEARRHYKVHLLWYRAMINRCVTRAGADVIAKWDREIENERKRKN